MLRKRAGIIAALAAGALLLCANASAFFDGQTGTVEKQVKAACPAYASGDVRLVDTSSPPGNMPMVDIFEHESGARCSCTRSRSDRTLRCGPTAPARNAAHPG